ncbi:lysylphosphatidylglycerol synthase transmembrane domain-containing protein [Fibrobacterota bacterium]
MNATSRSMQVKRFLSVAGILIIAACLFYLLRGVFDQWSEIKRITLNLTGTLFALSMILLALSFFFEASAWNTALAVLGKRLALHKATGIFYLTVLMNYLPLKGAGPGSRVMVAKFAGVPLDKGLASILLESWYSLAASGLIVILFLFRGDPSGSSRRYVLMSILWIMGFVLSIKLSPALLKLCYRVFRFFSGRSDLTLPGLNAGQSFGLLSRFLVPRILFGLSFWCLLVSMYPEGSRFILPVMAVQSMAWISTLVFFFVPKGIGVREVAIIMLLEKFLPSSPALAAALVFRLCTTGLELVFAVYGMYVNRDILFLQPKDNG